MEFGDISANGKGRNESPKRSLGRSARESKSDNERPLQRSTSPTSE
jgi:hypothetical protein